MSIIPEDIIRAFEKIPNNIPKEKMYLMFSEDAWLKIRESSIYSFTNEQLNAAKKTINGFICNSNGVDLYLIKLL